MSEPGLWREVEHTASWEWYCLNCTAGAHFAGDNRGAAIEHTRATQHTTRATWTNAQEFTGAELPCPRPLQLPSSPQHQGLSPR